MKASKLELLRLLLCGAMLGVAAFNILGWNIPVPHIPSDMVAGTIGASTFAVAFKLLHVL